MSKNTRKRIIQIALLLGTLISLYFVPWPLLKARAMPLPDTIEEQVNKGQDYGFDGIIVYVDQKKKAAQLYASGWKNTAKKIPADPKALFKIASIGKLYDAVAITKLVKKGTISLEKTLLDYFPALKGRIENLSTITVRMMVQHRSGLPNVTDTPDFWTDPPINKEETLERILDQPASFPPGERYEYSNTNYLLLSMLIEKATGNPSFQFIKEEILQPLGLQNTYGSLAEINPDDLMSGYYVGVDKDIKTVNYGSMIATAEDVGKFIRALNDGALFKEGEKELYANLYTFEHTGLIPGYQSIARYFPKMDAVVVQFTNTTDFEGYNWALSEVMFNRVVKIISKE